MGDEVETTFFLLRSDPQAHRGANDPENDRGADADKPVADQHCLDVGHEQGGVAAAGEDCCRFGEVVGRHQGRDGKGAGEQGSYRATHAVDGEGIEGVIKVDGRLHLNCDVAGDGGRRADD